ncbi:MAG: L,D-transpeptidase family protein [Bacteroidetes bacterium]|nr:L,D-transpeptidase family protein [Bacteroidota bacterium]
MRHALCLALLVLSLAGCRNPNAPSPEVKAQAAQSETPQVRDYYAEGGTTLWTDAQGATAAADAFLQRLCASSAEGLDPSAYRLDDLAALRDSLAALDSTDAASQDRLLARFEVTATEAFVRFAHDLGRGRVDRDALGASWHLQGDTLVEARALAALRDHGLAAALDSLSQHGNGYEPLRQALLRYRRAEAAGGWPTVSTQTDTAGLRRRLAAEGDLDTMTAAPLANGIRAFQQRHGLNATGTVNDSTLHALNVPLAERIATMEANLERLRWMPSSFGPTYVVVNIPDFYLQAFENNRRVMEMAVIVGGEANRTPAFADTMRYLAFAPYWNVPPSIASRELAGRSAASYRRRGYEVLRGNTVVSASLATRANLASGRIRLRQKPGPTNSLGQVKFMFPNAHNIYLHDTPADQLFARQNRALSHGCIRLSRPADLALWALGPNGGWDSTRVDSAMNGSRELRVNLTRTIPVFLVYQTAWVDEAGRVQFRDDLYGHDRRLLAALYANGSRPTAAQAVPTTADDSSVVPDSLAEAPPLAAAPDTLPTTRRSSAVPVCQRLSAR